MTRSVSRFFLLGLLGFIATCAQAQTASPDLSVVERWLATNSGVGSVRIDFTQIRQMRSVSKPVSQDGTLWIDYANRRFRWQTGDPASTIVVSLGDKILIIRTPGKKFEVRSTGSGSAPGMAAMANGFPRSLADFQQRYQVLEVRPEANTKRIVARPLGEAGRGVNTFTFVVDAGHYRLLGIEIDLEDGSSMRTVFRRVEPNAPVSLALFQPPVDGYTETKF